MKSMKRILSFVIMLALIVGMVPMSAVTARAARAASGDAETSAETETIPTIVCDEEKVLNTDTDGGIGLFSFVPEEDGVYRFFSYDNEVDTYGYILDEDMNELEQDDDSAGNGNFEVYYQMTAGWQYYLKSRPWSGGTGSYSVKVEKEKTVDHLELVSGTSKYSIEGVGDTYLDGKFIYEIDYPYDAVIRIVYKDGTSNMAFIAEWIKGYEITWDDNQEEHPWSVGTENPSTISYMGHTVNLPITVKENPVESIEVVSGKVTCIENAYGYNNGDHYIYDLPADVVVKINYTDGTSKTVNVDESRFNLVDEGGYYLSVDSNQSKEPWTLGDNNYLTLSYLDSTTQVPVSVIANPVDHIVINSAPTKEYDYDDWRNWCPTDLTGLSFTVYYTDGTSKTFTDADIDEERCIDGFRYKLHYDHGIGNVPVTFEYMGKSAAYTVVVKESTVASIEVTKNPTRMQLPSYNYLPDFIGMELTITYTDGTTKVVTLNEDNILYYASSLFYPVSYGVDVDGKILRIVNESVEGVVQYGAYYLDKVCYIQGITYTKGKAVRSIELDNVSLHGNGATVNITYADETTETLVLDLLDYEYCGYGKRNHCHHLARTANGLLEYGMNTFIDKDGHVVKYEIDILGKKITVTPEPTIPGDADGDGKVSSKDVTLLQRYLVGGWGYTVDDAAADVNADGVVNSKDVTLLRRYLVGGWDVELK